MKLKCGHSGLRRIRVLRGRRTTALALAGVFPLAAIVTGFAAALRLAVVLAFAIVHSLAARLVFVGSTTAVFP